MIKVLLADDHQVTTDGIKAFLEKENNIQVVGAVKTGKEVVEFLEKQPVDIAILDIQMEKADDGIEATKVIKKRFPKTKVLILSMYSTREFVVRLFSIGMNGYILKNKSKEELIGAIHSVMQGNFYIGLELANEIQNRPRWEEPEEVLITNREKQILCLLAQEPALTSKEMADRFNVSTATIESHLRNVKRKLEVKTKTELFKYAIEHKVCGD